MNVTQWLMTTQKVKNPIHMMRLSFQWTKNQTHQVNDAQETMKHVLSLVEPEQEADRFDPDADEEEHYNECEAAFNDEIIGVVMSEETETPSYEQDAYPEIDLDSDEFEGIREM